ncbi:MAG: MCP four helix bundle domain-containing protein, partial [Bauldia sp.]|nr:MCP four helix bundle domain-containing protein [Bauldia sp.]
MPISTRSLSIRTKLSIGFAVALAVVVAAGLLGVLQLRLLNSATTEITGDLMRRVVQLDDIERMMGEQQMLALRREQTTDDQQAAAVARRIQEVKVALDAAITAYAAAADMIGERSLFVRFAARVAAYENLVQAILRAVEAGRPPAEVERLGAE